MEVDACPSRYIWHDRLLAEATMMTQVAEVQAIVLAVVAVVAVTMVVRLRKLVREI